MSRPSDLEVMDALRENATEYENGLFYFESNSHYGHTLSAAKKITESCLILGVPVSDVATSESWHALVTRVVALEDKLGD